MLDDIVAHDIAQGIGIPIPATKDSLLAPWTRIASCLRPHPAGLALLITEQTFQKQACVPRNPFLPEQWTYPLLKLLKRRSPQRKRLFNRRCLRPRSSNHGCPWIQKSSERATVMLDGRPSEDDDAFRLQASRKRLNLVTQMLARKFWATLSWRSSFAGDNSLVVICVHESLGTIARHVRFCSAPVYCSGRSLRSRPLCLREWRSCGHAVTSASGQTAKTASYPFLHR